jgi:translation initiation factor 5A
VADDGNFSRKSVKEVKTGSFIMIDGVAVRVVDVETSSPGKHGSAKMRITGIGIFDGQKKTLLSPAHGDVEVPEIKKRRAQVVSVTGNVVQLMDMETYDVFDAVLPDELKATLKSGNEVETMEALGKRIIIRITGGG